MSSCCFLIYHSGSCSCREHLTLSERQQCLAKPDSPVFTEAVFKHPSGVLRTQPSQTLLSGKFGRHHSTVSHSERVFLSSLTMQMKEKLEETVTLPPHTAFALHSNGVAELYKVSIFFLL